MRRLENWWSHINILKRGYKPSWIGKVPRQRADACNPIKSALASNRLNMLVLVLLEKRAICKVGHIHGQYVSLYFVYLNLRDFLTNGDQF